MMHSANQGGDKS